MVITQARHPREVSVGRRGDLVVIKLDGCSYGLTWRDADDLAMDLKRRLSKIGDEGPKFLTVTLGTRTWIIPRAGAARFRRAVVAKARDCEEQEKAEQIALDQAILMRTNAPIGLSSDPKIQDEAAKEAAWNRDLRRFLAAPSSIRSKEEFGRPAFIVHPPKAKVSR